MMRSALRSGPPLIATLSRRSKRVPAPYREWDPLKKVWYIHQEYEDVLVDLVESRAAVSWINSRRWWLTVIPGPLQGGLHPIGRDA